LQKRAILYCKKLDFLNKQEFDEYMKFLYIICEREDSVGFSMQMLHIFQKRNKIFLCDNS